MGRETLFRVNCPLGSIRVLGADSMSRHRIGEAVMIAFDPGDTLVYDRGTETLLEGVHARATAGSQ